MRKGGKEKRMTKRQCVQKGRKARWVSNERRGDESRKEVMRRRGKGKEGEVRGESGQGIKRGDGRPWGKSRLGICVTDGAVVWGKKTHTHTKRKNESMKERDKKRRMLPLIQGC